MEINALPKYDMSDNPTNCCPRFNSDGWNDQELHFKDKLFVKAKTRSIFHIPINMGSVFPKTLSAIENANEKNENNFIVLSYDPSPWTGEHYFSVSKNIPGQEMVHMTGDYVTKIFEGPYKNVPKWEKEMNIFVESKGKQAKKTYFFYTTCPKCAKYYGKNYVVAVSEIE
jgi:Bacterial hydrolase